MAYSSKNRGLCFLKDPLKRSVWVPCSEKMSKKLYGHRLHRGLACPVAAITFCTQEKPRNEKGALVGLKDFIREPEP